VLFIAQTISMKKYILQLCLAALTLTALSSCVGLDDLGSQQGYRGGGYGPRRTYYEEPAYGYNRPQYGYSNYREQEQHYHTTQPKVVHHQDDDRPKGRDGHHHCDCADDHHKNMSCGCRPKHPKGGCQCGR
jgi:hypothetical protein